MKKIISAILAFSIIFLCSCSEKKDVDDDIKNSQSTTANSDLSNPDELSENTSQSWNSDLIPDDFPPPPNGTYDISVEKIEENELYISDRVTLKFTCPENEIYGFTNSFQRLGYIGGAKKISSPTQYFRAGFNGAWQNGKNIVHVSDSVLNEEGELTLVIEITDCKDGFPDALTALFPKFNGYSKTKGLYLEYDQNGNRIPGKFPDSLTADTWSWDYLFERTFIGVTEEEFNAYANELNQAGFIGVSTPSIADNCNVISYDFVKETEEGAYGVFSLYNSSLKTLDIVYTNEPSLFLG